MQCFIRLFFAVRYPKKLVPEERSQLIIGCELIEEKKCSRKKEKCSRKIFLLTSTKACCVWAMPNCNLSYTWKGWAKNSSDQMINWENHSHQTVTGSPMGDNSWLVLAIGNITFDLENIDFITSNRLSLGQNKDWNPTGSLHVKTIQNWF